MAVNNEYLIHDLKTLFSAQEMPDDAFWEGVRVRDRQTIGRMFGKVAAEISARTSSIQFPESDDLGLYPPSRNMKVALRYLSLDVVTAAQDDNSNSNDAGMHAFGAAIAVIAGLLDHLSEEGMIP